ncbi:tyrosine-type recombinase/integrase [Natrononativus amylolyticus]|uniref:tyrosine-type recombinase/integrase n=1 Tax=Natrononativus amylolyticus TaxID=2963434 RepID=UPI0020CE1811|nr:tyrosine-type recombinase/integrase [Natrononativus amylolyticus]
MTNVDDIQGYGRKFDNQLSKLADADIDENDRQAIERFIRHEDAQDDVNTGTMVSHLNRLRLSAERADVPLVEMELEDVDVFLSRLKREYDLSEGTRRNYRKALRVFFRWRGVDWAEDIKIGASPKRSVDPNDLLSDEEIKSLLEAAGNPRDKALVALLDDTGLRIGAIGSLRIGDLEFGERTATIHINEDANVKDASGPKPLTWSRGYVANWLDMHPRADDPNAALMHKIERWSDDEDGALTQQYLSRRIKLIAERADLDTDRVHTHLFRKTAISRWIREDMSEQVIKHRVDWAKDSQQFETYSGVRDEEMNDQILEHYDIVEPSEERSKKLETCPVCHAALRGGELFCPGCATPITDQASETSEQLQSSARDYLVDEQDTSKRSAAANVVDAAENDPELASALAKEFQRLAGND